MEIMYQRESMMKSFQLHISNKSITNLINTIN